MEKIILLAEDSAEDALAMREALATAGLTHRVLRMMDGCETLAYLKGEGAFADRVKYPFPSMLLLDIRMPRVDGFQVLEWIKGHVEPWKMLVVVLSAFDELHHIKQAYALGAHSFLTKPCTVEDIRNLMKTHKRFWQFTPEVPPPTCTTGTGNTIVETSPSPP